MERVKTAARDELASGHRTGDALEWQGGPWDRARFLAIRDSFRGDTPPRDGIEAALIDSAAEAFSDYLEGQSTISGWDRSIWSMRRRVRNRWANGSRNA